MERRCLAAAVVLLRRLGISSSPELSRAIGERLKAAIWRANHIFVAQGVGGANFAPISLRALHLGRFFGVF